MNDLTALDQALVQNLARILFPTRSARVESLSELREKAAALPLPVLKELLHVLNGRTFEHEREFLQDVLAARGEAHNRKRDFYGLYESVKPSPVPTRRIQATDRAVRPIDPNRLADLLGDGGALAQAIPGYESRPQQMEMANAVATAFNESKHLLVEAGTGVGKSVAYLAPSVLWAQENAVPVIVSTNTKNLQAQLMEKDLPVVRKAIGEDFTAVLIKGRRNYVCLRKLLHLLEHGGVDLSHDQKVALAGVLVWTTETETGDIAECAAVEGKEGSELWEHLTSEAGECPAADPMFRDRCFVQRARKKAQAADVVVANHAVVFSELDAGDDGVVLPPYAHIVFDEAHNIEQAATTYLSIEVSRSRWGYLAGSLMKTTRRKAGGGLLPLIVGRLEKYSGPDSEELRKTVESTLGSLRSAELAGMGFFDSLGDLIQGSRSGGTVRIPSEQLDATKWQGVKEAEATFCAALADLEHRLEALAEELTDDGNGGLAGARDLPLRVGYAAEQVHEFATNVQFVLAADDVNYVYWIEPALGRQAGRACAAPLLVGPLLHDLLFSKKQSVVLASATLSVMGNMGFMKGRLGLDRLDQERVLESNVGTPFDYARQCRVLVPTFLPEPGRDEGDYARILGKLLSKCFEKTHGRALVLFTSYALMESTAAAFREEDLLLNQLLVQGESSTREALTETFRTDTHSVLMGTQSFWEGVDVVGESLSCVVVTRLPFAVYTDPIQAARSEQIEKEGKPAFMQFSLPNAIIRFRQGFGRLIRHRHDRGIVIVTDTRTFTKPYGRFFRKSIAAPWQECESEESLLAAIESAMG